jgi:hypothetical protein
MMVEQRQEMVGGPGEFARTPWRGGPRPRGVSRREGSTRLHEVVVAIGPSA